MFVPLDGPVGLLRDTWAICRVVPLSTKRKSEHKLAQHTVRRNREIGIGEGNLSRLLASRFNLRAGGTPGFGRPAVLNATVERKVCKICKFGDIMRPRTVMP
jgi:hypothetical protein